MTAHDDTEVLAEAQYEVLQLLPRCTQCGSRFSDSHACGIAHAIIAADPLRHRVFEPLLAARDAAQRAAAVPQPEGAECNGLCVMGYEVLEGAQGVAIVHPDCELHAQPSAAAHDDADMAEYQLLVDLTQQMFPTDDGRLDRAMWSREIAWTFLHSDWLAKDRAAQRAEGAREDLLSAADECTCKRPRHGRVGDWRDPECFQHGDAIAIRIGRRLRDRANRDA